jgi:hypothetical protein
MQQRASVMGKHQPSSSDYESVRLSDVKTQAATYLERGKLCSACNVYHATREFPFCNCDVIIAV